MTAPRTALAFAAGAAAAINAAPLRDLAREAVSGGLGALATALQVDAADSSAHGVAAALLDVSRGYLLAALQVAAAALLLLLLVSGSTAREELLSAMRDTAGYYGALWYYWVRGGTYSTAPHFPGRLRARVQVYSLCLIPDLWARPHYRNGDFQEDMLKNLRDVALPGTGLPLSVFAYHRACTYFFLIVLYPCVAAAAALRRAVAQSREETGIRGSGNAFLTRIAACYREQLLEPEDWFSFWRMNCRLATLHASATGERDYETEDKWEFLTRAEALGVRVSPFNTDMAGIVCKHRNEEGGLGFCAFKNAAVGGDWIIQRALRNGAFLSSMLPENAPLSTFRVISASRGGLKSGTRARVVRGDVRALSCVWRAGRKGAITDHSAILFNVDPDTGEIKRGTTNTHWYQRGASKILTTPWLSEHGYTDHPDTGKRITGGRVENIRDIMDFAEDAHLRLNPHVPLCGWDVALTRDHGMLLLEVNHSCNFFRGTFDKQWYFEFVDDYFRNVEARREAGSEAVEIEEEGEETKKKKKAKVNKGSKGSKRAARSKSRSRGRK